MCPGLARRHPAAGVFRWILGFALLLAMLFVGSLIQRGLRLPLPGSIIGMLLTTLLLQIGVLPVRRIRPAADLLIRYMGLFFVPPGVALMRHFGLLRDGWPAIAAASLVGVVAVLVTVGLMQQWLERRT